MSEANAFVHHDPIRIVDQQPALVFGHEGTIILRGTASTNYFTGWRADFLYTGFAPILIVQLANVSGLRVVWYASSDGNRLGDKLADLSQQTLSLLKRVAVPLLSGMISTLLEAPHPRLSDAARGFLALDENCKREILGLCHEHLIWPVHAISAQSMPETIFVPARGDTGVSALRRSHLLTGLTRVLQDQLADDVANGAIGFTCPVTGAEIRCQGSLCFDDFHFAYRFTDVQGRLVFYVVAGQELSYFYTLFIPAANMLIAVPGLEGAADGARKFLSPWIANHFLRHGEAFATYLSRPLTGISSPLRAPPWTHIGHQLWNELSGIERYLEICGDRTQPEWLVPDGDRPVEFYGVVEALFPALRGRVRRGLRHADDLIAYAYRSGRVIARVTSNHVSARLRSRILAHAAEIAPDVAGLDALSTRQDGPIILLGLRLENRTLVDLEGFYARLIEAVLNRFPTARFVVDGHNVGAAGTGKFRSHGEQPHQARETEAAEFALLGRLRERFTRSTVFGAVGLTVPQNLRLVERCDAFIAPWGAGLAKYRWICNKPGYIISSRWNLERRPDLRIYNDPRFTEAPAEMVWIRPELVTDQSEPPRIVGGSVQPQWFNFTIDEHSAIADFSALVDRVVQRPQISLVGPSFSPMIRSPLARARRSGSDAYR